MSTLDRAIELAIQAHAGQFDKAGEPYILHPLRVMLAQDGEVARIVGVLHDAVEDSDLTLEDLEHEGFAPEVIVAVDSVTRRGDESYSSFIERAGRDPIGRLVKIADLRDNLRGPVDASPSRREKYLAALRTLKALEQQND